MSFEDVLLLGKRKRLFHIHKNNITRNEKVLQGEKTGAFLFMNSVNIIMNNTSRSYLNGLIIMITFFQ